MERATISNCAFSTTRKTSLERYIINKVTYDICASDSRDTILSLGSCEPPFIEVGVWSAVGNRGRDAWRPHSHAGEVDLHSEVDSTPKTVRNFSSTRGLGHPHNDHGAMEMVGWSVILENSKLVYLPSSRALDTPLFRPRPNTATLFPPAPARRPPIAPQRVSFPSR